MGKVIVGQEHVIREVTTSIFAGGHILLVGVPGLAKTLLVNTIAQALGLSFNRIQFTPDLMPSDIVGAEILDESRQFKFVKSPLFSNIVLADEINRTPPKTQAALPKPCKGTRRDRRRSALRATRPLLCVGHAEPHRQEGTYPLLKRSWTASCSTLVDYPTFDEELNVVKQTSGGSQNRQRRHRGKKSWRTKM